MIKAATRWRTVMENTPGGPDRTETWISPHGARYRDTSNDPPPF